MKFLNEQKRLKSLGGFNLTIFREILKERPDAYQSSADEIVINC